MNWDDILDDIFDNLRRDIYSSRRYTQSDRITDILETDDKIYITLDWRSLNIDEINIELKHDVYSDILVIMGSSPTNYYSKTITLSKRVKDKFIKNINNGIISIELDVDDDVETNRI